MLPTVLGKSCPKPLDVCRRVCVLGYAPDVPQYTVGVFIVWIYTILFIRERTARLSVRAIWELRTCSIVCTGKSEL